MNITDVTTYFNQLLKPELFDDYCPNGLQSQGHNTITKLAFAVSATQDSIQKAIDTGAQGLVVHHGILWKHAGARPMVGAHGERVRLLMNHGINLWAYHLPLDAHAEVGNAVALGKALGLQGLAPFGTYKRQPLGVQGQITPLKSSELKTRLEKVINHPVLSTSTDPNAVIKSVGIITGGAQNEWVQAQDAKLDAYITGEISEYNWHDTREVGLHFFAGGHHATEKLGIQELMNRFLQDHPGMAGEFFDSPNPV